MMNSSNSSTSILLELDEQTWKDSLDRVETWLGNVLMIQTNFRQLIEDTVDKVHEPHIRAYLADILEQAKQHEQQAEELSRVIGRDPSKARKLSGTVMSKVNQVVADIQGVAGGARGGWQDLRQLLLANLDSMGAFAIAEQLGLALGLPQIVDITFPIVQEKSRHQLLLQEYMLEMAPVSILYKASI
jgi:hypothetical protein